MRKFGRLRHLLATHRALAQKLAAMERKYDGQFKGDAYHLPEADGGYFDWDGRTLTAAGWRDAGQDVSGTS